MTTKPFLAVDIEIRSENIPAEITEAIKKSLVMYLQAQKFAIPSLIYDIQEIKEIE